MILGTTQLDKIQKKEENIIKKALGLSTRLHSSELMICLGINRMDLKLDSMLPSFFYRLLQNQYTNDFIRQVINNNIKIDKKSIIYHIINKFKTKDMNKLNEKCKLYKGIIDKNFEYEKNELKQFSKLPNLLENMKSNLTEIILSLRAF